MRSKSKERSERNYTSARERAEKQSSGFSAPYLKLPDNVTLFKPKAGTFLLDILPFEAGEGNPWAEDGSLHWERTFYVHRGIGANNDSFLCSRLTSKERCPVCEHRLHLMKNAEGDEDKEQLAKDLAPKQRQLFNVINLKDPDQKIQLWDISYHLFGKILDARLRNSDEEDNWDQFFFLEDGLMLKVGFAEKTYAGHSFFETETIDFKPRKEDYDEEMLEKVVCLDEILVPVGYNELKKILLQVDEEDEEDDKPKTKNRYNSVKDEDEEESSKKKKRVEPEDEDDEDDEPQKEFKFKKKSKSTEDEDGDADEDEEEEKPRVKAGIPDDEDEDEEEPAPKKKSAAPEGKKKLADDDDWDDFDEEEEEEETTPKKKTKK